MPTNAVQISNVESGDVIPRNFSLTVDYENATGSTATVSVTCLHVAVTPQSAPGPNGTLTFAFNHAADHDDISFSVSMLDTGSEQVASDDVELVDVTNTPPIGIDSAAIVLTARDLSGPLAGKYDKAKGNAVIILVQRLDRGRRRPILFLDPATLNAATKRWSHAVLPAFPNGRYLLRAILTQNGSLVAVASKKFAVP